MSWWETFRSGSEAVFGHRFRSALTVLGVLIGIAAVILTVGLGEGAQKQARDRSNAVGRNMLVVLPASTTDADGVRGGAGSASTLTVADAAALSSHEVAPDVAGVAPIVQRSKTLHADSSNWTTTVVGTTPSWLSVRERTIAEGRFLTASDEQSHAAVVVLGPSTARELFGNRDALGQTVTVSSVPLQVVGVLNSAGASASGNEDDQAVVPRSTAATRLFGGTTRNSVSRIYLKAKASSSLSAAYQEANQELLNLHHVSPPTAADFTIASQQSLLTTATSLDKPLIVLFGAIAGLSLLVGGIGGMNVMLVSVTERIREIGLRKALGAPPRIIRRQFLVEASVLGLAGGVIGSVLGVVGALLLPHAVGQPIAVSVPAIVVAILVAVGIGIGFGVYPASRAARLTPVDALRNE